MPAQYVKAYIKRNKHDAADAEAICEAVGRPTMRFVPVKTAEQQATALLHRGREQLVRQRAATAGAWGITSCDDVLHQPSEHNDSSDRHSQREDHDWEHDEDQFPKSRQHVSVSPLSLPRSTKPRRGVRTLGARA